jgi:hypothetical protein
MIAAIFSAIAAIPEILGYVEKFSVWLAGQIDQAKKKKLEQDMAKAAELAKTNKDTSKIDDLFSGK